MKVLVHIDEAGRVFVNYRSVSWLRVIDDRVFVKAMPGLVVLEEEEGDGGLRAFLRAPLKYEPWHDPEAALRFTNTLVSTLASCGKLVSQVKAGEAINSAIAVETKMLGELRGKSAVGFEVEV